MLRLFEQCEKSHNKETHAHNLLIFCVVMYFVLQRERESKINRICVFVHLSVLDGMKEKSAKFARLPGRAVLLMQPLLDKRACHRARKTNGTWSAQGRRELPDVSDLTVIKLISACLRLENCRCLLSDALVRNSHLIRTPSKAVCCTAFSYR